MKNYSKSICLVAPYAGSTLSGGHTAGGGGAERQLILLGGVLLDLGWDVGFVTGLDVRPETLIDHHFKVNRVPFYFLRGKWLRLLQDLRLLWYALNEQGANLVGLRAGGPVLLGLLKLWCLLRGAKLILWVQSDGDFARDAGKARSERALRRLARRIYRQQIFSADLLIVQTGYQYAALSKLTRRPCVIIPSLATFKAELSCRVSGGEKPFILWAGNPTRNKRVSIVLALAKLLPAYQFVIAMNPGERKALDQTKDEVRRLHNVKFLGAVPSQQMEEWFDRATIVLNTSVIEGFPNTFLQAWARGIPVVTAGIDPDGLINRCGMGIVVPVIDDDSQAIGQLASALRQGMEDDRLRMEMGRTGYDYVVANHSPGSVGKHMDESFKRLFNVHEESTPHV